MKNRWKKSKLDYQAELFVPGPTQRNALENFHKSKERVFKIRDDHGEERR